MSGNTGDGTIPSGFFAPQQSSKNQSRGYTTVAQNNAFGYVHNYGQPVAYNYPYGNVNPVQAMNTGAYPASGSIQAPQTGMSRKRAREEPYHQPMFRCDPCGLDLDSAAALEAHKKSHVKCNACDFEGAPKVVKGHYQSVHGKFSGNGFKTVTVAIPGCPVQRFRICVGNHPDDVQKWIAERKKKFPRSRTAQPPPEPKPEEPAKTEGLSTLLEGYSSSEDEKEELQENKPALDTCASQPGSPPDQTPPFSQAESLSPPPPPPRKKPCHAFVRHGRCRRGDACPYSHDDSLRRPQNGRKQDSKKKDLLSNLLEADVDRESKLSLQLIHYLVHSDFLKNRV